MRGLNVVLVLVSLGDMQMLAIFSFAFLLLYYQRVFSIRALHGSVLSISQFGNCFSPVLGVELFLFWNI